ncbi:1-aminocyclopropane-1-carboxylate oxidase homolog 12 [Linum grandiflorum]
MELPQINNNVSSYDRTADAMAFDDTKAGVKGLVDSGVTTIPRLFIHHHQHPPQNNVDQSDEDLPQFPVIDLSPVNPEGEREVVEQIRKAAETWGFFQIVNHGIAADVMEEMLTATRRFHELRSEEKMELYSRDATLPVRYISNGPLLTWNKPADWRDTLAVNAPDGQFRPEFCPPLCSVADHFSRREALTEYLSQMKKLKNKLSELLSEAAGLSRDYLSSINCMDSISMACHYYPTCPQPDLTIGAYKHTDPYVLTIVLQDGTGGLQVLHRGRWFDVSTPHGALVVNIGDFLQLITNDMFKSAEHRVKVWSSMARCSVVSFFLPSSENMMKAYSPAKELLSEENQQVYRDTHISEFLDCFMSGGSPLSHFRLSP